MASLSTPVRAQNAGPVQGMAPFQQRCAACHGVKHQQDSIGPNLAGIVGRPAGATTYDYSPAMRKSRIVWNTAELDAYLVAQMKKTPGVRMGVSTP